MSKLNYNFIRIFISIVEHKNMARAAEQLDMLPGSVSYAVAQLRKHYNDPLFVRNKSGIEPTALAQQIYHHFKEAEINIEHGFNSLKNQKENINIIVNAPQAAELFIMKKLIDLDYFSGSTMLIFPTFISSPHIRLQQLRSYKIDLDIGPALQEDIFINKIKLKKADYVLVTNKNNKVGFNDTITPQDTPSPYDQIFSINWLSSMTMAEHSYLTQIGKSLAIEKPLIYRTESYLNIIILLSITNLTYAIPRYIYDFLLEFMPVKSMPFPHMAKDEYSIYAHFHRNNKKEESIRSIIDAFKPFET
ncbi:LysR family transcriptional regulator [Klebsiella michiganensis]|uniref:LysR family transcriptional regulator n=1 Tax=Klebsiella michiganensis TaxID=1134687 RepID=UPI00117BBE1E|nr:LysR family transcriptional regulator [Klebsiella michiganensis]TRW30531.1 LysR family transcriptional regulator [Klebsiella michiganensis]TRW33754.1 LysR family transcriptional regulator [Klebsiella michiganensis]